MSDTGGQGGGAPLHHLAHLALKFTVLAGGEEVVRDAVDAGLGPADGGGNPLADRRLDPVGQGGEDGAGIGLGGLRGGHQAAASAAI